MKRTVLFWSSMLAMGIVASATITTYYLGGSMQKRRLIVSTTTSLYDTGLLDRLEEEFETQYPVDLHFISVGTGMAIEHAKRGDADLILVHAPSAELAFLAKGHGICRKIIAYNFFVIVGPADDPAGIEGLSVRDALTMIVDAGRDGYSRWISRGDNSGTHLKEKGLWISAGFDLTKIEEESWYIQSGTGMGRTLLIADEKGVYSLSDIGTYLEYHGEKRIDLYIMASEEKALLNTYSVISVDPKQVQGVNLEDALTFTKFLVSDESQGLIANFKKELYGQSLFYSAVRPLREDSNSTIARWIRELAFINGTECPQEYNGGHPELYGREG